MYKQSTWFVKLIFANNWQINVVCNFCFWLLAYIIPKIHKKCKNKSSKQSITNHWNKVQKLKGFNSDN